MKRPRIRNSAGDTIVEVLIVLAILGLAFAISYATANRGLIQSRNAEEHSESLGIVDSQVELLRSAFSQQVAVPQDGTAFCMKGTTPIGFVSYLPPASAASDDFSKYPSECNQNTLYYESVVYDTANNDFDLRIRWEGLGNLGRQQEEITYKISPLSITGLTWSNNAPPIIPVLAASGGTGPGGAFYPADTVHITVTGVNPGDSCVIKGGGTTYLTVTALSNTCIGTFPSSNLPANSITNLKASVTDNGTVYISNTVSVKTITSSITPVLAATCGSTTYSGACSGGSYHPGDAVNITVTGVNPGDSCVIKGGGITYLTVTAASNKCIGSFSSDNLPANSTTNLTASVTDNGIVYTSNTVSVRTVTPACPLGFHQSTAASYQNYIQFSGNSTDPPYCVPLSF